MRGAHALAHAIGWYDHVMNPWWGRADLDGQARCRAVALERSGGYDLFGLDPSGNRKPLRTFAARHWDTPLVWNRAAHAAGRRRRVYCSPMADVFDDHPQADAQRAELWRTIRKTAWLDWLLVTARPERAAACLPADWGPGTWPNVWLGTEVQGAAHLPRLTALTQLTAPVRFVLCLPLTGPLPLWTVPETAGIDWAVIGGESGPGSRVTLPVWIDNLTSELHARHIPTVITQTGSPLARHWGLNDAAGADPAEWPRSWGNAAFPQPRSGAG